MSAHDFTAPVPEPRSQSGCATCPTSRCCIVFDPELTAADLHRLVRGLGLDPADVAELAPIHAEQAEGTGFVFDDQGGTWELRLRRTSHAFRHGANGGRRRCGFLLSLGPGLNRCGVYEHRPMVCRTFPSDFTTLGVMVGNPPAVCPPNAWSQARADLVGLHALHLRARAELALHRGFVAAWNDDARRSPVPRDACFERLTRALLAFWDTHHVSSSTTPTESCHDKPGG